MTQLASNPINTSRTTARPVVAQVATSEDTLRQLRALAVSEPITRRLPEGLDAWWHAGVGRLRQCVPWTRLFLRRADRVLAMAPEIRRLGSRAIRDETQRLRDLEVRRRAGWPDRLRLMAVVREVARRELGLEPYPVQIAAALAGTDGKLIEMATGEGKSLVAASIAAMWGLRGRGVHVMTVNDYLAERDAEHFRQFFAAMGLSVAAITQDSEPHQRQAAYQADLTYLTNKEAAADFLRDRVQAGSRQGPDARLLDTLGAAGTLRGGVQRGLIHAIVDEADSILIDEAVTPLILSGEAPLDGEALADLQEARTLARQLQQPMHFRVDRKHREIDLTRTGKRALAERVGVLLAPEATEEKTLVTPQLSGVWRSPRIRHELVLRALSAEHLFHRDQHYVIQEGKVVIVDESTGRLMPDRSWRDGLHQAVEIKEDLQVTPPKATLARVSFQRFFRGYRHLTGMTGTAMEARGELWQVFGLTTARIPTHRRCLRQHLPDHVFVSAQERDQAVIDEVQRVHPTGRPVLVGTRSVQASEALSAQLQERGLPHTVLNAVHHEQEAQIVALAGQRGAITVATNMAGRGTDIKLPPEVKALGGLHVIACERHESNRVDRQLIGRAARQGDPGSAVAMVSFDDELIERHAKKSWRGRLAMKSRLRSTFRLAQRKAAAMARRQRKGVLKQDQWLEDQLGFAGIE